MKRKEKLIIGSDVEFRVEEEVKDALQLEIKKVVDEMSNKYMRSIKVTISVDVA